ncbi:MAG: 4-alpha-glucanotransferase [Candidatus Rokubacteria bacterium]|nr:4-alpha-glucanotransferase [Candidatus Rokubacteria bacterium]
MTTPRRPRTDAWAIDDGYFDALGVWRPTSRATHRAIVAAMGGDPKARPQAPTVRVVRAGAATRGRVRGDLTLEDGRTVHVDGALPHDLPLGYHTLHGKSGATRVIVVPPRCHLPDRLRIWGWAAQLYATRSRESWGIGDLADLRRLARWSAGTLGARLILLNPLAAAAVTLPQQTSPYYPSSRRFRNPLYLRVEDVPGARDDTALAPLVAEGRSLNAERRVDRDRVFTMKMRALETLWKRFPGDAQFESYRAESAGLREYAIFCALTEEHRRAWQTWPAEHRRPDAGGVRTFAEAHADRVGFHEWLQWLIDRQLAAAGEEIALMQDLPIGVDPDGADAWMWQDVLATGASVGAPPDRYIVNGQDWGLPPFVPHRLAAAGYEPFVQTIRAALRHAGGLRIDHVMGLFRLFWVPHGLTPADGVFVRHRADDLLGIVALESARARAFIVGEDLGTVEDGVRERLAEQAILSYKVVWFEPKPPAEYPPLALAAVTTHDLPTIRGLWTGADIEHQKAVGQTPNEAGLAEMRERLKTVIGLDDDAPLTTVVEETHRLLAEAPCAVVTATLDDALLVEERPNMPGTVVPANWSLALPKPLEEIETDPTTLAVARALARAR